MGFVKFLLYNTIYLNVVSCSRMKYKTYEPEITKATPHVPRVVAKVCFLKPDPGPCRANIPMFYFDPATLTCSKFSWGGCQGNGNRFDYEKDCMEMCLSQPNEKKKRPRWCNLTFDYGFCFGDMERWYYDKIWKVCKKTIYSGCGGNRNNFYNKEECDTICRLGAGPLPPLNTNRDGLKKVLVINPWNTTPRRGREQTTRVTGDANAQNNITVAG